VKSNGSPESSAAAKSEAPHPGAKDMPRWTTGELVVTPTFTWRNWFAMLRPGLVMGASAICGGEWLVGPKVTAVYGGGLLWLATLSVLRQVIYNIEISGCTLYSGEPIFTEEFRTLPGPHFWLPGVLAVRFRQRVSVSGSERSHTGRDLDQRRRHSSTRRCRQQFLVNEGIGLRHLYRCAVAAVRIVQEITSWTEVEMAGAESAKPRLTMNSNQP